MNKKEIKKELERHEKVVAELRKKLEEPELKPFDWTNVKRYEVHYGEILTSEDYRPVAFCFDKKDQAQEYDKQLRLNSVINNLKKSLEDDHVFTYGDYNYFIFWNCCNLEFDIGYTANSCDISKIYMKEKTALEICKYLIKNWDWKKGQLKWK